MRKCGLIIWRKFFPNRYKDQTLLFRIFYININKSQSKTPSNGLLYTTVQSPGSFESTLESKRLVSEMEGTMLCHCFWDTHAASTSDREWRYPDWALINNLNCFIHFFLLLIFLRSRFKWKTSLVIIIFNNHSKYSFFFINLSLSWNWHSVKHFSGHFKGTLFSFSLS